MKRLKLRPKERRAIRAFIEGVTGSLPNRVERIVLFGSKSRGGGRFSDTDLAIILSGKRTPLIRAAVSECAFGPISSFGVDISPLLIPSRLFREGSPLIQRIKREGIELWPQRRNLLHAA